jgi:hypothetical protein
VVLNDSYHLVTLDRQRQLVVARTLEFAQRLQEGILQTLATEGEEPAPDGPREQRRES